LEEEAIKKAEEELAQQRKVDELNAKAKADYDKKQEEATKKYEEAKKMLEDSGAEFVSREEFEKLKADNAKAAPAA